MTSLAYEKWQGILPAVPPHPAFCALRASRLDSFLADSQDDGVMVIDRDGVIIDCNLSLCRRTGYSRTEVLGRSMLDVIDSAQRRRIRAAIDDVIAGDGVRARADGVKRSGGLCELAITFIPLFDDDRHVVGALVITQNLSEASEAARASARDGALLELAGHVAGFVGWTLDLGTGTLEWSDELPSLRGATPRSLDALLQLLGPADSARLSRAIERSGREQRTLDVTVALRVRAEERHVRLLGRASPASAPGSRQLSGAAHDVTDAVLEQRQRMAVEELLSSTVNAMTDGFAVIGADWRVTYVNDRIVEFVGVERDQIIGAVLWDVLPELVGTVFDESFRTAVAEGSTVQCRGWSDDRRAWLETIAYPSGGGVAVHLRDITETESARRAYQDAQEQLATLGGLLDISRDAIIVRDLDHRVRYANAGAIALYGWDADEIVGVDGATLLAVDLEQRAEATAIVLRDGHWAGRIRARTADGRDLVLASRWQLMRDESGAPESILSVSVDVTEEVAREEALRRAERLESLGTFAGGIAHDLNNVLTPITLAAQLLGQSLDGTPDAETAAMIETAARRGARMVRQVLTFARGVEEGSDRVEIPPLLDELRRMVADSMGSGVELRIHAPEPGTAVIGDATQLLQVLTNLVGNANDAIAGEGTITVDARRETATASTGATLVIDVVDTGHGMSPEVIARLWEPFFTTKPLGKGTGLGLPMVAAIVRAHGGSIAVDSDGRTGSRFTVTLPLAGTDAEAPVAAIDDADVVRGDGRTVLVVDDEEAIRALVRQLLVAHGYHVLLAAGGDEALRLLITDGTAVDVVLSDITMPGGDGAALVAGLAAAGIRIPIVLMSGREDAATIGDEVRARTTGFLVKPLTTSTLLMAVHAALEQNARGGRP
jgi:PAS domain S-box-containing protein